MGKKINKENMLNLQKGKNCKHSIAKIANNRRRKKNQFFLLMYVTEFLTYHIRWPTQQIDPRQLNRFSNLGTRTKCARHLRRITPISNAAIVTVSLCSTNVYSRHKKKKLSTNTKQSSENKIRKKEKSEKKKLNIVR